MPAYNAVLQRGVQAVVATQTQSTRKTKWEETNLFQGQFKNDMNRRKLKAALADSSIVTMWINTIAREK